MMWRVFLRDWALFFAALVALHTVVVGNARAAPELSPIIQRSIIDPRCCHASSASIPRKSTTGRIIRSATQRAAFTKQHPCPVTERPTVSCPGWAIDHVVPLANGGCDAPHNMQWLPLSIKSCADDWCKDRWERRVYTCWATP